MYKDGSEQQLQKFHVIFVYVLDMYGLLLSSCNFNACFRAGYLITENLIKYVKLMVQKNDIQLMDIILGHAVCN